MIKNLKNHPYSQCKVLEDDNLIKFISYTTTVIIAKKLNNGLWDLKCTGLYSRTTIRQIGWFLNEYFHTSYGSVKLIAGRSASLIVERRG